MRIAVVNTHVQDKLGGSEIQCDNIASGLQGRGHNVYYLAVQTTPKKNDYGTSYNVIPVENSSHSIAHSVLELNPDIVYWRFNKNHFYKAARLIKQNNIKIVFALSSKHDTKKWLFQWRNSLRGNINNFKSMLKRRYNHGGFNYVDGVTSLNPDYLNKVDVPRQTYVPNSMTEEAIPFKWEKPYVLWVASIKAKKRPEQFIALAEEISEVDFIMVGEIQQNEYNWIYDKGEELENYYYLGKKSIKEVNGILKNSLFLVHTCKPEGFGNNFIQAWLQAKPAVSLEFDPGGYITAEDIGYICNGEFETLVQKTKDLIKDDMDRIEKGKRAYNFVKNNFSIDKTVGLVEKFMEEIIRNN